jgi:hypothetical protein
MHNAVRKSGRIQVYHDIKTLAIKGFGPTGERELTPVRPIQQEP